jgi:hypothetical protein
MRGVTPRTRKSPEKERAHRHIGIRRFANLEDKKLKHFKTPKSEIPTGGKLRGGAQLTSTHQNRGIGNLHSELPEADLSHPSVEDACRRSKPSGKVPIGQRHRKIGDRGIEESKNLDIRTREIPIRDISIRSGLSDHTRSGLLNCPKASFAFRHFERQRTGKARSALTLKHVVTLQGDQGPIPA